MPPLLAAAIITKIACRVNCCMVAGRINRGSGQSRIFLNSRSHVHAIESLYCRGILLQEAVGLFATSAGTIAVLSFYPASFVFVFSCSASFSASCANSQHVAVGLVGSASCSLFGVLGILANRFWTVPRKNHNSQIGTVGIFSSSKNHRCNS